MANRKVIIPLTILFLTFSAYLFPHYQGQIREGKTEEITFLDAQFSYSLADVETAFKTMEEEGRQINIFISGVLDMIFPLVYGPLFFLLLIKLSSSSSYNTVRLLGGLPLLAVLFDYAENFSVVGLLKKYPDITASQVSLSATFTSGKWIFVLGTLLAILGLVAFRLVRRGKNTKTSQ